MNAKIKVALLFCFAIAVAGCSRTDNPVANDTQANLAESNEPITAAEPCRNVSLDMSDRPQEAARNESMPEGVEDPTFLDPDDIERGRNILTVEGGDSYRWNDRRVDRITVRQFLDITHTMAPTPSLIVRRGPAADEAAMESARELIYLSLDCRAEF